MLACRMHAGFSSEEVQDGQNLWLLQSSAAPSPKNQTWTGVLEVQHLFAADHGLWTHCWSRGSLLANTYRKMCTGPQDAPGCPRSFSNRTMIHSTFKVSIGKVLLYYYIHLISFDFIWFHLIIFDLIDWLVDWLIWLIWFDLIWFDLLIDWLIDR